MDTLKLSFRLRFVVLISGVLISAGAVALFVYFQWATSPKELLPVVSAGIALTALAYAAMNVHLTTSIKAEELRLKRLEYALNFIDRSAMPDMVKAIRVIAELRKAAQGKEGKEVVQMIEGDPTRSEALIMVFNYFERLGIIVRLDAADENALKDYYSAPIRRYWHSFSSWVSAKRDELQTTDLFCEFEYLAKRWH